MFVIYLSFKVFYAKRALVKPPWNSGRPHKVNLPFRRRSAVQP